MKLKWDFVTSAVGETMIFLVLTSVASQGQTPALPAITQPPPSVPYRWRNVVIRGGGFVSGLLFSPSQSGLVYARTDVGGVYRSEDAGEHWTPLLDSLGRDEVSYLGIESIAIDPEDASKLYVAAGMYSAEWGGPSAIFRSNDKGHTFERSPMTFKMGGNDDGRGSGERLAVDPTFGSILFFGSRTAGLWKSNDSGATWAHVDSFPSTSGISGPAKSAGITFVLFDDTEETKGRPTRIIYAGAAQADGSLYKSVDAGATWRLVDGSPKNLIPNHAVLARGTALYLSYNDNVGPNGITDGAIWKYSLRDGKWQDISPVRPGTDGQRKFGFGGLALDPTHPETLMVTTIDRWHPEDTLFRTTDGGRHWKDLGGTAHASAPSTPWVYWHREHTGGRGWMNDIKIDPFNSARALYTTGEGIWGSTDVTALDSNKPTQWRFTDEGIEETVPLALISPPTGAPLLSGIGDIGGFRHEDLLHSPKDGFFIDPQLTSTSGLDFAALTPSTVVRVGYGDPKFSRGGYSTSGGERWKPFASEPASSKRGGGHIAIAANAKTIIWSPDKGVPYWTEDWGSSWTKCVGLSEGMRVTSDRVNPSRFYSFNRSTGQLLESADAARTFSVRTIPIADKGQSASVAATPGVEGDVWISAGGKTYHSADAGETFVILQGMTNVATIGFGMAAPGRQSPAIYVNGFAASQEGTFRSDNDGESWVRIDDTDHQYGWKNDMTGDPRVYGRVYLATGGRGIVYGDEFRQGSIKQSSGDSH